MHTISSGRNFFFKEFDISAASFPTKQNFKFPFQATRVILTYDEGEAELFFSFRRPDEDGKLICSDGPIAFDQLSEGKIWFKKTGTGNVKGRIWAWRGAG